MDHLKFCKMDWSILPSMGGPFYPLERIGFYYPEEDDFKTVDINTIVLNFEK